MIVLRRTRRKDIQNFKYVQNLKTSHDSVEEDTKERCTKLQVCTKLQNFKTSGMYNSSGMYKV